ncbi:MAG: PAS domain S-box protein, partial [Nitrosomonadales bacterium]|nr:PAS domain S-box protein [Nitrosomonadales bacterium]
MPELRAIEERRLEPQRYLSELKTQNEQLRELLVELEKSRDLYVDFYDFSPVGYLTLDHEAMIDEINLTGADLLGMERSLLRCRCFTHFVALKYRDIWYRHVQAVLNNDGKARCELPLERDDGSCFFAQLDCLRMQKEGESPTVRMVLTDITARVQAEKQLLGSMKELEEKELSKTRFLAAAGHDLRQPVAAANLFVDALKLTSPTPRQSELIARLDQSMGVFSGLLERLL